jgi:hypothetical protein
MQPLKKSPEYPLKIVKVRNRSGKEGWVRMEQKEGVWIIMGAGGFLSLDWDFSSTRRESWGITEVALRRAMWREGWQILG